MPEEYSEELQYAARVCHQLYVNIGHLQCHVSYIEGDEVVNEDLVSEQVKHMKSLLDISGERFKSLLLKETSFKDIVVQDNYPFVAEYPDWINELFPYSRKAAEEEHIIQRGGSMINFDDGDGSTLNHFAVEPSVPDSFVVVWYPIAAQVRFPGFIWKSGDKNWLAYGFEQH